MTDKKEVSILLLGIVAILAIVGLVLLFTSPAATGKAFFPPGYPPEVSSPIGYDGEISNSQSGQIGNAIIVPSLEGANLPRCPNGAVRTRAQGNLRYTLASDDRCAWFECPELSSVAPMMACLPA